VRILVVSARFPEHGRGNRTARIRGDQIRAFTHISYLADRHSVTVITSGKPSSNAAATELRKMAAVRQIDVSDTRRVVSGLRAAAMGQPIQTGWSMPGEVWEVAQGQARGMDVALAMTARSVRGPLSCPLVVDHVDALSWSLAARSRGTEPVPVRWLMALESRLMASWERRLAQFSVRQIVTSAEHAEFLPSSPPIAIIPAAWLGSVFREPRNHARGYDVIVTGDMRYPPSREAALIFAREIVPRIRARQPSTTAIVVGRSAATLTLPSVDVASDVPDISPYLQNARVAVVPLLRGPAGSPYKVIEAAANGAALVTVAWAADCFGLPARRANTIDEFAKEIVSLLEDEPLRRKLVADAIPVVERHSIWAIGERVEAVLLESLRDQS
jgi:Glycosyl transferases group 1